MIVDVHSHLFPAAWNPGGGMPPHLFSMDGILDRQEEGGIDVTVISDPHIWYGSRDTGDIRSAMEYNDFAASLVRSCPDRLAAMGSVTPWRGAEHCAEAVRAVRELGLAGLAISTSDRGRYLDAVPDEFWHAVQELNAPVFIHPGVSVVGQEFMQDYRLAELCGRPLDMTVSLSRFILTGALDRHPGLRLLCAHAGGAICAIADRLDFGYELRKLPQLGPWGPVEISRPPSKFVAQLYLDTVTYGIGPLRLALETVGDSHICFGTDGPPVPLPASKSRRIVETLELEPAGRAKVLGENATALFALAKS